MKRAFRVILPILLAIAVLGCIAWYFLVYDQAFTKELLLTGARYFEDNREYKIAAWLYDVAYEQSHRDDDVAIELAYQYRDIGNYTKAEYTLSQAISANSTPDLYKALCGIYVEQDKLMDAVSMLDTIVDPEIKAQLDAMRPAAPVLTPEPGFYSQYIDVDAQHTDGTLYINATGEYPSIHKDEYKAPISLSSGETRIYALVVGTDKLVSPLVVSGYTITGVIEPVTFTDNAMEAAIREAIGAEADATIYTNELWDIKSFTIPEGAKDYTDLKLLPYLTHLTLDSGIRDGLSILSSCPNLEGLTVTNTRLTDADMEAIGSLKKLTALTLSGCSLSSIAVLDGHAQLEYLDLSSNTLRNLTPLVGMPDLKTLLLGSNALTDLSALQGLSKLETLDVSYNSLSTLSPLYGIAGLKVLNAAHNQIFSLQGMETLVNLTVLGLSHNNLSNVTPIAACTALKELDISNNAVESVSSLSTLVEINILGMAYNKITELPQFDPKSHLVSIDFSHNTVESVESLTKLSMLNTVNADYNPELEDLKPLDTCPVLVKVNAYGTKVTEVSFLTQKSIIVNFNPTLE